MQDNLQQVTPTDTPRISTPTRSAFWQRHVTQWRDSGLSKVVYCQQNDLVYHQMVYWSAKAEKGVDDAPSPTQNFVAVNVAQTTADNSLCVRLPNGISIVGIDERSVTLVGQLVEQL